MIFDQLDGVYLDFQVDEIVAFQDTVMVTYIPYIKMP